MTALEVLGADLPPEPPVGSVVMVGDTVYQLRRFKSGGLATWRHTVMWVCTRGYSVERCRWVELLARGPVTVLWRPPAKPTLEPVPIPEPRPAADDAVTVGDLHEIAGEAALLVKWRMEVPDLDVSWIEAQLLEQLNNQHTGWGQDVVTAYRGGEKAATDRVACQ